MTLRRPAAGRARIALALCALLAAAAPAHAETRIVDGSGQDVSSLLMIYGIDRRSSPTDRHLLIRDTSRRHYLFTLDEPCSGLAKFTELEIRPPIEGRARASESYDLVFRGRPCNVVKIQQVPSAEAGKELAAAELAAAVAAEATGD